MANLASANMNRRQLLKAMAGGTGLWLISPFQGWFEGTHLKATGSRYRVGVGKLANPYDATLRAVEASGEWPAEVMAGRTVVIKPNLVVDKTAGTGATTDPEVVRALVDLSLESGAGQVSIGAGDGYVCKYNTSGNELWTRQFGS